jgi:hypothetical protein
MSLLAALVARTGDTASTIHIARTILGKVTDCVHVSGELVDSLSVRRVRSDSTFGQLTNNLVIGSPACITSDLKEM